MDSEEARSELIEKLMQTPQALNLILHDFFPEDREVSDSPALVALLFDVLFDIRVSPEESKQLARTIDTHRRMLESSLDRTVDFRVAALDYFFRTGTHLVNPKITELSGYENKFRLATTDELTGLYNRRFITDVLDRELHRARRYQMPFSLLFLDIDDFKLVNDNFGHQTGDVVLRSFAEYIKVFVRSEDIVGRYGGEEFLVVMPQTDTAGAVRLAKRLIKALTTHPIHPTLSISFSGGISTYPVHAQTIDGLIEMADIGLYRSKMQGKRQIQTAPDEKRHDPRYPVGSYSYLKLECQSGDHNALPGRVHNVSRNGISFEAEYPLSIGDSVQLRLHAAAVDREYQISGEVIWTSTLPHGSADRESPSADSAVFKQARYRVGAHYAEPCDMENLFSPQM